MRFVALHPAAFATCLFVLFPPAHAAARQTPDPMRQQQPLRVFLDCQPCDFDHFRREVAFVDYVRDRTVAQLHVLVTEQDTGAGGDQFTFYFLGQQQFAGREDTLRWTAPPAATEEEERRGLTRTFQLGLVPFAARTPIGEDLTVLYDPGEQGLVRTAMPQRDPWNFWVFQARVGTELEAESRSRSLSVDGSISANRTTDDFKLDLRAFGDYSEDEFELSDGETFLSSSREYELGSLAVWSLGPHWSAGFMTEASSSTRLNQDMALTGSAALEYNIYPYSESTRRRITFLYTIGPAYFDYDQITLFERVSQTTVEQQLDISAAFQQPWGEIDGSLEGSTYLHDVSLHRIDLFAGLEIRLFRGFNLDLRGNVARIKNQIYVPLEDIPLEEILLRRRELGTDFEYEIDVGVSFTFGSLFNNVVNPRMNRDDDDDF